ETTTSCHQPPEQPYPAEQTSGPLTAPSEQAQSATQPRRARVAARAHGAGRRRGDGRVSGRARGDCREDRALARRTVGARSEGEGSGAIATTHCASRFPANTHTLIPRVCEFCG